MATIKRIKKAQTGKDQKKSPVKNAVYKEKDYPEAVKLLKGLSPKQTIDTLNKGWYDLERRGTGKSLDVDNPLKNYKKGGKVKKKK